MARLIEIRLDTVYVGIDSGHKTLSMLQSYTHLSTKGGNRKIRNIALQGALAVIYAGEVI